MQNNPNFEQNLTPFQKGQTGNPKGRPTGPITQFLREYGDANEIRFTIEVVKIGKKGTQKVKKSSSTINTGQQTINQAVAASLLNLAINGDMKAIQVVLNRTEGRVPQPVVIGRARNVGAQLKAWTAEEIDKYEEYQQLQARQEKAEAATDEVDFEELPNTEE